MLHTKQIARYMTVHEETVRCWRVRGLIKAKSRTRKRVRLKAIRKGGRYLIAEADLRTFLAETGYDPLPEPLRLVLDSPGSLS